MVVSKIRHTIFYFFWLTIMIQKPYLYQVQYFASHFNDLHKTTAFFIQLESNKQKKTLQSTCVQIRQFKTKELHFQYNS